MRQEQYRFRRCCSFVGKAIMEDYCVCCGAPVPEGRQVCPICEAKAEKKGGDSDGNNHA